MSEGSGLEVQEFDEKGPDVDAIKHEFNDAKANLSFWMDKAEEARECRFNEWAGKDGSGKKNGPEAFPWESSLWRAEPACPGRPPEARPCELASSSFPL